MKADNFMNNGGWPQEAGVELRGNAGAPSKRSVSKSGEDYKQESGEGLLEEILALGNLNFAYKRVKGNGGSHGIEEKLKLKVNQNKSAVDRPSRRKFLGFSFYIMKGKARNFIHAKCIEGFKEKVRVITTRSNGRSIEWRKERLNRLISGWVNYFRSNTSIKWVL